MKNIFFAGKYPAGVFLAIIYRIAGGFGAGLSIAYPGFSAGLHRSSFISEIQYL